MSRYLLLLLLNLPFISAAILTAITQYKLKQSSRKRMLIQMFIWVAVATGLAIAQPIYDTLIKNGLTDTDSLSLFDVVQITAIVFIAYIANRLRLKTDVLDHRVKDLQQELSIILSTRK